MEPLIVGRIAFQITETSLVHPTMPLQIALLLTAPILSAPLPVWMQVAKFISNTQSTL